MEDDEDIEIMFSRFQTLVSCLQVLSKNYTTSDHVMKILRSLSIKWRSKITVIQEAKGLNNMGLETLISYLKSHVI
jgi:hypothetical protein